ncbi:MAG TPA: PTS sugar transporter subunit IIA [Acidobacteriota bacterium]|nr:PTS sugar transporter subunit IIA [Acidobacteriota bacterium]
MKLHSLLSEDLIVPDLKSLTRDEVLKEIVGFLNSRNRISKDRDLYDKLVQREELGSTAIGDGVAIPHCKLKGVKSPLLVLGISHQGVAFDSLDGKPSHLFFLVVSSPDNPSMSLQILAAIAQLVRKATALPRRVLEARSPKAVIEIVRDEEDKPHG